ncbi:MAG: bifunctional demethylmenaquinone methyltransferase/2-methoxy-6-polyprenyl-1,4-benzoquinol methylase UbiE [Saprospiraceae bacterium]|nr:bifunctional demethylmenaquinone methyltransferase/2-methoxy-6-polyprenyl-1,4-benzoquinol methylase UbiE [Saprospiraceae bacterium]
MTDPIKEVTPYNDEENKKGQVTKMFNKIAPYYDYLNRLLSLGIDVIWRKKAIKTLVPYQPQYILDIATGTADLAIEAYKSLKPKHVTGMDISSEMIRIGDNKLLKKKLQDVITLEIGDSENLKYEDGQFDAVTAAFGVRNFGNLEKGLIEMHRVLKQGGRIVILEFSKPKVFPLKQLFNLYFKNILPVIGKIKSKDPKAYQYLYESVQVFPDYENFIKILKKIGFHSTDFKPLSFGICTIYTASK